MFGNIVKTVEVPCDDCDAIVVVVGSPEDSFDGWICNDCDKKNHPEDYDD